MKGIRNFGTILVIASLITSLGLIGCAGSEDPVCLADSCTPNGICVVVDGSAVCECDTGYKQGEGLTCVTIGDAQVGDICVDDADCADGRCLKYTGDTEGYCTTTNCVSDSDCVNHATGESAEMCCVEVDVDYFICLKVAEGYACSSPVGPCGLSCTDNPNICSPTFPCMGDGPDDPNAICSAPCATSADCSSCEWSKNPDARISCKAISGGDKYCLVDFAEPCLTGADCPEGETCTFGVSPDMTDLFGECMNVGGMPPGSECNDEDDPNNLSYEERCSGFYCLGGMCSEVCVEDTDCPEGMICETIDFCLAEPCDDPENMAAGTVCTGS